MTIQDQIWLLAHSKEPEDRREWAVLYWKSQGLTHREIADKLGYGKDWVQRYMTSAYRRFGAPKDVDKDEKFEWLQKNVFPALKEFIAGNPDTLKELPPPPTGEPEILEGVVEEDSGPTPPPPPKQEKTITIEGDRTRHLNPWIVLGIIAGIIVVCVGLAGVGAYLYGRLSTSPVSIVAPTTTQSAVVSSPIPTQEAPTIIAPTNTLLPTDTLIPTPVQTDTPAPSATPVFVPPADGILFQDNFQNSLNPAWQQYSGKWIVSNGKLSLVYDQGNEYTDTYSWIGVENPNWKNYIISLNIYIDQPLTESDEIALAVRDNTSAPKYIGFEINFWPHIYLSIISQGYSESAPIAGDNNDFTFPLKSNAEAEIKVENNNYTLSVNGSQLQTISISGYDSGGFRLGLYCRGYPQCPTFSNVKVTYLP